ncbi:MAG: DEAD/DEAH box helicase [Bryobacteraceae bacterium]|jgi:superfamily II DNA or RNA helicase
MKLSNLLSTHFENHVRLRGSGYYHSGAVRIKSGSEKTVDARVTGAREYLVELTWDGKQLNVHCSCPYFDSSGPCKHLWAVVLAAEALGYLAEATGSQGKLVINDYLFDAEVMDGYRKPPKLKVLAPPPPVAARPPQPHVVAPPQPAWRDRLKHVTAIDAVRDERWPADRQLIYIVDTAASVSLGNVVLNVMSREPKRDGGWKKALLPHLTRHVISLLPDPADRYILSLLAGASAHQTWMSSGIYEQLPASFRVMHPLSATLMPLVAATGRCFLHPDAPPLAWDDGEPWRFELRLGRAGDTQWAVSGCLRRGDAEMNLKTPELIVAGGLVFTREHVARLAEDTRFEWLVYLRRTGRIETPESEAPEVLAALLNHPVPAHVEVPEELRYEEVRVAPKPCLTVRALKRNSWEQPRLSAELSFDYDGRRVAGDSKGNGFYDAEARRLVVRDLAVEESARSRLGELGMTFMPAAYNRPEAGWELTPKKLPAVVRAAIEAGWHIEADGKTFRRPGAVQVSVASGIDWFELHGEVAYGDATAKLPALLAALKRGDSVVLLDDGTYGLLPEEWLARFASLASLGDADTDHIRFRRNQAGLLDALLAAQPEANCDETFTRLRDQLRRFDGVRSGAQPAGFIGQLRDYQRDGLGWMEFLRRFSFGGCLADDMGVGKTAQVLAMLEARRAQREAGASGDDAPRAPSLVVVPKSLVFNWKQEAARFTPKLRVLDHTGSVRDVGLFDDFDIVLTTYGTLRRDAAEFRDIEFDYLVLDEAQNIKNANTGSAKAVRLLRGRHRLALSGTPVENHLGELWSLFEFLNPGMLGAASVFKLTGAGARNPSPETRSLLAAALRPFILRRTKDQVARELPSKSEQTIYCELEGPQRRIYNELRAHYRAALLGVVAAKGLAKSKIQVLEALLRLRQAACHPGLLDPKLRNDPSAKIDMLIDRLREVVDEGHKALVFSQFTSLLSIVRGRLDEQKLVYEYLDGATTDRQERVEHFQTDPACPLFLISLKAGGLGLNLTAAEYVFLLDPWWNPAVEAQAVDRAHRIGQTRQVFAYRLIARDTVEEKVLELQSSKRDLAAAIISQDNSLLRNLKREDLELLLS